MDFDSDYFLICTHYLSALINDDYSGLSEAEGELLDAWIKETAPNVPYHWDCDEGEGHFGRDAVSGLMGDVISVGLHSPSPFQPCSRGAICWAGEKSTFWEIEDVDFS